MALPSHHRTDFLLSVGHAPLPSPQDTLRDSPICNIHLFASSLQHLTSLLRCLLPLSLLFDQSSTSLRSGYYLVASFVRHYVTSNQGEPKFSELPASLRTRSEWSGALLVAVSEDQLESPTGPAVFLCVVKPIDDRGDPLKSAMIKWLQTTEFLSQPYKTATRSAPDHSVWSSE